VTAVGIGLAALRRTLAPARVTPAATTPTARPWSRHPRNPMASARTKTHRPVAPQCDPGVPRVGPKADASGTLLEVVRDPDLAHALPC